MHPLALLILLTLTGVGPDVPELPVITSRPMMSDTSTEVEISVKSNDPKGRDVVYRIDWGDNTPHAVTHPAHSGDETYCYHTYKQVRTMSVRVKASSVGGDKAGSDWSKTCSVAIVASLVKWTFPVPNGTFCTPALDDSGNLYFGDEDGVFCSLTPDGKLRWSYRGATDAISAPAVVANNTVYFPCDDKHVYALTTDGKLLWSYLTATPVVAAPAVTFDGTVYCADDTGNVYCLNSQGILKWSFVTNNEVDNGLTIGPDGTIYVPSDSLYALSPAGKELWARGVREEDSPFYGCAIGPDDDVYAGNMDGDLYRLEPKSGRIIWSTPSVEEDEMHSEPVFGPDNGIYFGDDDHYITVKFPNGPGQEFFEAKARIRATPAINRKGTVYAHSSDGTVYCLTASGKVRWQKQIGTGEFDWAPASPVIAPDGTVYVGSFQDALFAFLGDAAPLAGRWSMQRGTAQHTGRPVRAVK